MNDQPLPLLPLVLGRAPRTLRQALAQEGVPFVEQAVMPAGGRFVLFDSAASTGAHALPGQTAIDLAGVRKAWNIDPFEALEDEQVVRRGWRLGPLAVGENVARHDKRALRERLLADLRKLVENAGGIWLRVSAFPFAYRTAFNFRIDHDDYHAADFEATLTAAEGYEDAISHYVCASTHARQPEALARLAGRHVGSHGYWHHTYSDSAENVKNIGRGIEALRTAGIEPAGFAAPHGRFHRGLYEALASLGVAHSSEFALACDELPFYPYDGRVLQLPVHPICLGVCLEAARDGRHAGVNEADAAQVALAHFRQVIDEKHRAGEPIFLYGHADGRLGRYPHVLRETLAAAAGYRDLWRTTLAEFADWWQARGRLSLDVVEYDGQLTVRGGRTAGGRQCAVEYFRGPNVARLPLDGPLVSFSAADPIMQSPLPAPRTYPAPFDQPEDFRVSLRRYLDWEKVTPVEEISTRTWRGWAKKTLRRIKD
ncbi:MAG TPA: hypothetical protein VMV10_02450 [Pirellulales bacterium]|nr:hypothetical protein [Pirellulales bacterium]